MNTQYAKQKIEKLMAVANHPNTNLNEAANARDMAKKVAEKYGVLTWFFLTYEKVVTKVKMDQYILSDRYRWIDITNTIYQMFACKFDIHGYTKISKKSGYYANIILDGTEKQVEFLDQVYKIILKAKNQFKKEFESKGIACHMTFTYTLIKGFEGEEMNYESECFKEVYKVGKLIRNMFEEKAGQGW